MQPFHCLVGNCRALRLQRVLSTFTNMTTKSKVLNFWHKMYCARLQEKHSLVLVFRGLYQQNVYRCFRTWRVHTTVFSSLLRRNAVNQVWHKWKLALAALRLYKRTNLLRVFSSWKSYFLSIDATKLLLLKKRRLMWKTVLRYVSLL